MVDNICPVGLPRESCWSGGSTDIYEELTIEC